MGIRRVKRDRVGERRSGKRRPRREVDRTPGPKPGSFESELRSLLSALTELVLYEFASRPLEDWRYDDNVARLGNFLWKVSANEPVRKTARKRSGGDVHRQSPEDVQGAGQLGEGPPHPSGTRGGRQVYEGGHDEEGPPQAVIPGTEEKA